MPGPPPKRPETRARRNAPAAGEWIPLPADPYKGPKPRMPRGLSEPAKAEWKSWWASPMAHAWDQSDHGTLLGLIRMFDAWIAEPAATSMSAEIRQWKDKLGLTPEGRQKRRWALPLVELAVAAPPPKPTRWKNTDLKVVAS